MSRIISEADLVKQRKKEIQTTLSEARPPKPLSKKRIKAQENRLFQEQTAQPHPERSSILSRPRFVAKGRRRAPSLLNANGIPVLLIKKPQPQNLSRFIRLKSKQRERQNDNREKLEKQVLFGQDEDRWDKMTESQEEATWREPIQSALNSIKKHIHQQNFKKKEHADKLWRIVLAERKLAEIEKQKSAKT